MECVLCTVCTVTVKRSDGIVIVGVNEVKLILLMWCE